MRIPRKKTESPWVRSVTNSQAHYCNTWDVTCSNQVDFNGSLSESAVIQPLPSTHIASADGRCRAWSLSR